MKGIGTAINDSIGDGKEVIVDSVPIKCIDNPAVFSPSRLTITKEKADHRSRLRLLR